GGIEQRRAALRRQRSRKRGRRGRHSFADPPPAVFVKLDASSLGNRGLQTRRARMKKPGITTDPLWYKDAVLYELHVRAFFDSNDDGIGDLPGVIQNREYRQDLGVACRWLLPFFPSPLKDDGYDISDSLNVHPMYGT